MLSQGEQRRLAVLSVLAGGQELLLLDEPTYGQDSRSVNAIMEHLREKVEQEGLTVIFITHNIEEAVYLSENILVLTNKPTSIKRRLDNPLPRPRNVVAPSFIDLRNQVTELIKWW